MGEGNRRAPGSTHDVAPGAEDDRAPGRRSRLGHHGDDGWRRRGPLPTAGRPEGVGRPAISVARRQAVEEIDGAGMPP